MNPDGTHHACSKDSTGRLSDIYITRDINPRDKQLGAQPY